MMVTGRRISGVVIGLLGTAWSGGLIVAGLWLCWTAPGRWPMFAAPMVCAGLTLLAMGQFVFLSLVADRAFPELGRGVGRWIELCLLVLVLAGIAGTVWLVVRGSGGGAGG